MQPIARTSMSLLLLALLLCTTANSSLAALMVGGATAAARAQPTGGGECTALQGLDLTTMNEAPAKVSAAAVVPAEEGAAAYCRVTGYVWPQVKFELRLPIASAWNGNFYFAGCGGFCGTVDGNACTPGLERGYAAATTDAGHSSIGFDGLWAWNNPQAQADLGYRGVHVATVATKAITEAYYGRPIRHAYFQGCSNGGRQGVMEAVRYPADFDGIIAGAPLLQRPERDVIEGLWMTRANRDPATGAKLLSAADVPLIHEAVLHACDGLDGLVDGIIDDPRACHFDPATLQCPADGAGSGCLSVAQVDALRLIYSPPRNSTGEPLYASGMVFGSEPQWPTWVTGTDTAPSLREVGSREALRYMAFEESPGPSYDPASFDFDSDPPLLVPIGVGRTGRRRAAGARY